MNITDLQLAEEILIDATQNEDIIYCIENEIETWDFDFINSLDNTKLKILLDKFEKQIFQESQNYNIIKALERVVFDKIHDSLFDNLQSKFIEKDKQFFKKCKLMSELNISAEHFGADENYTIPLAAAIVELSVLDSYRNPSDKMNCLCSTYDLVFAELKSAMVAIISQNSEKDNEIPVIDNKEIIPILMAIVVKSKLVHVFSNLFYIKCFYDEIESKHVLWDIFKSFEKAIDNLEKIDVATIQLKESKIIQSINLEEYMKITSCEEKQNKSKTLVEEANQRVLTLITKSTIEDQVLT